MAKANRQTPLPQKIALYQQVIRGWMNYFRNCRGIAIGGDNARCDAASQGSARCGVASQGPAPCGVASHVSSSCDAALYLAVLELSLEANDQTYALQLLKERNKFSSPNLEFGLRLGRLMRRLNQPDQALNEFSRVLSQHPDCQPATEEVRQIESIDPNCQKRIERIKKIIHCAPDLPQAYQDLSLCYAEAGEFGLAQEAYQKFLELKEKEKGKSPAQYAELPDNALLSCASPGSVPSGGASSGSASSGNIPSASIQPGSIQPGSDSLDNSPLGSASLGSASSNAAPDSTPPEGAAVDSVPNAAADSIPDSAAGGERLIPSGTHSSSTESTDTESTDTHSTESTNSAKFPDMPGEAVDVALNFVQQAKPEPLPYTAKYTAH